MADAKRAHHVSVVMNDDERQRLDDWMDSREPRIRSRSEAIRQLIARGLTVPDDAPEPAPKTKRARKST